jgi:hypothetical protein
MKGVAKRLLKINDGGLKHEKVFLYGNSRNASVGFPAEHGLTADKEPIARISVEDARKMVQAGNAIRFDIARYLNVFVMSLLQ